MGCAAITSSMWSCQDEDGNNTCYKGTEPEPGECFESFINRAGSTGDTGNPNVGDGIPSPNKIRNVTIPINCDYDAQQTMILNPGTDEEPAEYLDVTWVWDKAPNGLSLDPHSGKITGNTGGKGQWPVTIYARDEAGNEIDQKTYQVTANDCSEGIYFQHPMPGSTLTSDFGPRTSPCSGCSSVHKGTDFAAGGGTPILAAADGVVTLVRLGSRTAGNYVVVGHNVGDKQVACTRYLHMQNNSISVTKGQAVTVGQQLGKEGNTGVGTGPHLHFEIRDGKCEQAFDPMLYINGAQVFDSQNVQDVVEGVGGNPPTNSVDPGAPSGSTTIVNATNRIFPADASSTKCSGEIPISVTSAPANADTSGSGPVAGGDACGNDGCDGMTQEQVIDDINRELDSDSSLTAGDKEFILFTAKIESNYDPCAKNSSSTATGLYQMIDSTASNVYSSAGISDSVTCADRIDTTKSTKAMTHYYKSEIKPAWESYNASGKTKINGLKIKSTSHSARYSSLNQMQFCYGLIHHDGIGNAVDGIDKGGVNYITGKLNGS